MIVVRVELWSAITGEKTELARMHIANDGTGTARRGNYTAATFIGRSAEALDRGAVSKRGAVLDYPRADLHIWNLITRALIALGYTR